VDLKIFITRKNGTLGLAFAAAKDIDSAIVHMYHGEGARFSSIGMPSETHKFYQDVIYIGRERFVLEISFPGEYRYFTATEWWRWRWVSRGIFSQERDWKLPK
jgi:hypothetical protein